MRESSAEVFLGSEGVVSASYFDIIDFSHEICIVYGVPKTSRECDRRGVELLICSRGVQYREGFTGMRAGTH